MTELLLGVDAGNYRAKVAGAYGVDNYRTAICDWFEQDVKESFGSDDMEFEIDGRRGFAGTIAANEDIYGVGGMYGDSKAHEDVKIRVLLAIYRYINRYAPGATRVKIVTGTPINSHKPEEKARIADMLLGEHVFTVNEVRQRIVIESVGVAPEGSGAFWSANTSQPTTHIIDVGSGTVNLAKIVSKRHINTASGTFNFGMETVGDVDLANVARAVIQATTRLRWRKNDVVLLCGGVANDLRPHLAEHFADIRVLSPMLRLYDGNAEFYEPVYANAVGYYTLARGTFK